MTTKRFNINNQSYTFLTLRPTLIKNNSSYNIKVIVQRDLPTPDADNYFILEGGETFRLESLSINDVVYVMGEGVGSLTVTIADNSIAIFTDAILQEDNFLLSQEDGSKILIEI